MFAEYLAPACSFIEGTFSNSSTVASSIPLTLPKARSSARLRAPPTPGNTVERRREGLLGAKLSVMGDRETMRFVAHPLRAKKARWSCASESPDCSVPAKTPAPRIARFRRCAARLARASWPDPTASTPSTPTSAIAASAIASCPLPPSTTIKSGRSASSLPRAKRRLSTSSIMPKSSPPEEASMVRMR